MRSHFLSMFSKNIWKKMKCSKDSLCLRLYVGVLAFQNGVTLWAFPLSWCSRAFKIVKPCTHDRSIWWKRSDGPFSSVNQWSWLMVSRAYTPSVEKTIVSERGDLKHDGVLKKTKFNASKHASTWFWACLDFYPSVKFKTSWLFFNRWINNRWRPHMIGMDWWKRSIGKKLTDGPTHHRLNNRSFQNAVM